LQLAEERQRDAGHTSGIIRQDIEAEETGDEGRHPEVGERPRQGDPCVPSPGTKERAIDVHGTARETNTAHQEAEDGEAGGW